MSLLYPPPQSPYGPNDLFDATGLDPGSDLFMYLGEQAGVEKLLALTKNWPRGCAICALAVTACDILMQNCDADEVPDVAQELLKVVRSRIQWNALGRRPEMWRVPGT